LSERRGFTLIEVVLSLAILAMVVAVVFSVLRLAHRAERKGTERSEISQRIVVIADRLTWLLAGAYPYMEHDKEAEKDRVVFSGDAESLGFVTTSVDKYSPDTADLPGLKYVRLWLGPEGLRADERLFYMKDEDLDEYVIEPNAVRLEMEYMEQDPETGQTEWVGAWDPEDREYIPRAVSVRLVLDLDGREVMVPRIIVKLPAGGSKGTAVPPPRLPGL